MTTKNFNPESAKSSGATDAKTAKSEPVDYSAQIDKLRETEPHKNTNKYIEGLIKEATAKVQKEAYSSGFWNGFVIGVFLAFMIWTFVQL